MRWLLLCCVIFSSAGCDSVGRVETGVKDIYVEVQRVDAAVNRVPYPLDSKSEERAFVSIRDFSWGRREGRLKLGQLLGQYPDDPAEVEATARPGDGEDKEPGQDEFALDLSEFPERSPPSLLIFPDLTESRVDSGCYLGHAAYLRPVYAPSAAFVHHLRLLVVNRHPRALRVPLDEVTLEVAAFVGDGSDAVARTERDRVATAGADGGKLDVLVIPPREARLAHVFFFDDRLPPKILVRWTVEMEPDAEGDSQGTEAWTFSATLVRRFVLEDGAISDLEARVAYEQPLAASAQPVEAWLEPRLVPVPGGGLGGAGE